MIPYYVNNTGNIIYSYTCIFVDGMVIDFKADCRTETTAKPY